MKTSLATAGILTLLAAAPAASAPPALVPPQAAPFPVVTVVKIPTPWYAPRALVVGKMRDTVPQYEQLPGLAYKMFSLAQDGGQFGGIYFWRDRERAGAWFNPAWFERVEKERGAPAQVRYFEAPVTVDNTPGGTPASLHSSTVATLVLLPAPPGTSRQRLLDEFRAAAPAYQKVPGLLRKHFVLADAGEFGGIYLWRDQAAAQQWFSAAWRQRVQAAYGTEARMEWFDTPILTPSVLADNRVAVTTP